MWEIIKKVTAWAWKNKQTALIIALVLAFMISSKCNNDKNLKLENDLATATGKTITLQDNLKAKIEIENGKLTFVYKDATGKIQRIVKEIPREGRIEIELADGKLKKNLFENPLTTGIDSIKNLLTGEKMPFGDGDGTVQVVDRGLTRRLGLGIYYDGNYDGRMMVPAIDVKLAYWGRYGVGFGTTTNTPMVFLSRYVDDLSFGVLRNVELSLMYGKPYKDFQSNLFGFGIRTNL